jgi:hypothetical protein
MRGNMTKLTGLHYIGAGGVPVRDTKTAWVLVAVAAFRQRSNSALEKSALAERRFFTV